MEGLADTEGRNDTGGLCVFYFVLNESLNLHSHSTGRVPASSAAPLDTVIIPEARAVDVTLGTAEFTTYAVQSIKCF